ncbi:MAG: cellulase family glycosylhydrolase, partial [Chitinivibrionales bacterium]|nr:cellulase family glycosylhydrolase [Chitinivibrionales bacterium]
MGQLPQPTPQRVSSRRVTARPCAAANRKHSLRAGEYGRIGKLSRDARGLLYGCGAAFRNGGKGMRISFLMCLVVLLLARPKTHADYSGFHVDGRHLYDPCGNKVVLRGVNKMVVWNDIDCAPSCSEIAQSGTNCLRIVWTTDTWHTSANLDTIIARCASEDMIPMPELHGFSHLSELDQAVAYWTRSDVLEVISRHEDYLIINIANEVGEGHQDTTEFKNAYAAAVTELRNAGIHVPLVIDADYWGLGIDILQTCGPYLTEQDPDHNLLFSAHPYWSVYTVGEYRASQEGINAELDECVLLDLPVILGELCAYSLNSTIPEECEQGVDYLHLIKAAHEREIGWLAWSWGNGNNPCTQMDMTTDGTFETLHGWGREVAVDDTYS